MSAPISKFGPYGGPSNDPGKDTDPGKADKYGSYTDFDRIAEAEQGVAFTRTATGDIFPIHPPIRTLTDMARITSNGILLDSRNDTESAGMVPDVLAATMKHHPTKLNEYKSHRRHVEVVDSYGGRDDHHDLEMMANALLMAKTAYKLTDDGIVPVPRSELRIPDPENYNFHDKHTRHDRQDPYTVHVGTSSDLSEALHLPMAGNATRMAKQAWKTDPPVNYSRVVQGPMTDGSLAHSDHKRDCLERTHEYAADGTTIRPIVLVHLATGYRGQISQGHGSWHKVIGKDGRPTTRQGREDAAAAQLANVIEAEAEDAGREATRALLIGRQSVRIQTLNGYVITVRRQSQSSIKVDVKRAGKRVKGETRPTASTRCTHESYVGAAIDRMLTKLNA